jgi:hypothetical protein
MHNGAVIHAQPCAVDRLPSLACLGRPIFGDLMSLPFPPYYRYLLAVPLEPFAQRCMGGSGIRSAVGAVVGICSRWEASSLL